jgi:lysophospholipase L1-like esterase
MRIMPLGDSITDGDGSTDGGGYRRLLSRALAEAGQEVTFVGSVRDEVAGLDHEGHPGWEINDLTGLVEGWLTGARPDAVLLHIGTNDLGRALDLPEAPARLGTLIDTILRTAPTVTLHVASLAAVGTDDLQRLVDAFNAEIPRLVKERVRAGFDVRFVDLAARLTRAHAADRLHPNDLGYAVMADTWFAALTRRVGP